jgi:hypothetical protein
MWSSALVAGLILACSGCPRSGQGDCNDNAECASDEVCGRDHACTDPSNVREVTVTWTVNGGDANAQTCASQPEFTLSFFGSDFGDEVAFTPVPCSIGQFFVDRLPKRFTTVELGIGGPRISISASGTAMGDLDR